MDESQKRREAAKAANFESPGLAPGALSQHQYNSLPRFNYYADPMSAFSGSKTMDNISPQVLQGHYNTPPRPTDHGMIPNPAYHYPAINYPSPSPGILPRPHFNQGPVGSPMGAASSLYRPQQNPPSSWVGSGGALNYNTQPNFSRGGNLPNSGFGQGCPPCVNYGRGRGPQDQNMGSYYDSRCGRGRGRSYGNNMCSTGSRPSFKRGASSYYKKEMVQDPWLGLRPVAWKGVCTTDSDKSQLPKPIAMKKLRASPEAP